MTHPAYAELHAISNFSFLEGASHPEELVAQAKALGLSALAITDRNTLAGVVRAHVAAKEAGLRLIIGVRLDLEDAPSLVCLPSDRKAYGRLCRLLSLGQGRAIKGQCSLTLADVSNHAEGQNFIVLPPSYGELRKILSPQNRGFQHDLRRIKHVMGVTPVYLAASSDYGGDDCARMGGVGASAYRYAPRASLKIIDARGTFCI